MLSPLLIRVDATSTMGYGHFMRMLALGQAWQERGGVPIFVMRDPPQPLIERLKEERIELRTLPPPRQDERIELRAYSPLREASQEAQLQDAMEFTELASFLEARLVVVDSYQLGPVWHHAVRDHGFSLCVVDDNGEHEDYRNADVVLNGNLHAQEAFYTKRSSSTALLLREGYTLLRREFRTQAPIETEVGMTRHVLVTMGGTDVRQLTEEVLQALDQLPSALTITVVLGLKSHVADRVEEWARSSHHGVDLKIAPRAMAPLIRDAKLVITAAGSTCYEICALGVPFIALVVADNQRKLASEMVRRLDVPVFSADPAWVSERLVHYDRALFRACVRQLLEAGPLRDTLIQRMSALVDGQGALRVADALLARLHPFSQVVARSTP